MVATHTRLHHFRQRTFFPTAPVSAGVIHFKGQIVEYGCNLAPHDRNIEVSCLRNNIPHL
ncbi:hypothetical protein MJL48_29580, partial [Salmonella enterica subsp. enterica serovar Kentucky]|nr:hypothetical protein [Salmonella enterica subsp. enterica serovar Kentucky]